MFFKRLDKMIDVIKTNSPGDLGYGKIRGIQHLAAFSDAVLNQVEVGRHVNAFLKAASALRHAQMRGLGYFLQGYIVRIVLVNKAKHYLQSFLLKPVMFGGLLRRQCHI